jgi:hypothetical protein
MVIKLQDRWIALLAPIALSGKKFCVPSETYSGKKFCVPSETYNRNTAQMAKLR